MQRYDRQRELRPSVRGTRMPRRAGAGLIRVGYEQNGMVYLLNFVTFEPVVD